MTNTVSVLTLLILVVGCSKTPSQDNDREAGSPPVTDAQSPSDASATDAHGGPVDGGDHGNFDATSDAASGDATSDATLGDAGATRDPLQQPFASTSIWNMPIGSAAVYVAADVQAVTGAAMAPDDDIIVLTPMAPATSVYTNTADWSTSLSRCGSDGGLLFSAPIPTDFIVSDPLPSTPNSALAVLLEDSRTLKQTQPFARCTADQPATSHYVVADEDLYGEGTAGAHGGSGLSAIGGTLRIGELRPNGSPPHHALKIELDATANYYNDGNEADCFRWPALQCDTGSTAYYGGDNSALRPGSLLALPVATAIGSLSLQTQPGQMLAWTLQNYGAYVVDDVGWSAYALCVENGPNGDFEAQFQSDWGFSMSADTTAAFGQDVQAIVHALSVVDNSSATTIGGGGAPLQALAPGITAPPGD